MTTDVTAVRPYVLQPGEAELRWMGETSALFLATGKLTGGVFALVDERAMRGESVPLHRHPEDVESFYVLEGEISFFLEDRAGVRVGAGGFVHVPVAAVHGFRVESETARYLILTTPRLGAFFEAITLPSREGGLAAEESVDGATIRTAARACGIEFVGSLPED